MTEFKSSDPVTLSHLVLKLLVVPQLLLFSHKTKNETVALLPVVLILQNFRDLV